MPQACPIILNQYQIYNPFVAEIDFTISCIYILRIQLRKIKIYSYSFICKNYLCCRTICDSQKGKEREKIMTRGGRKNKGPAFSAGQWPSLACKAENKWTPLLNAALAFSYVIFSFSTILIEAIFCLKFFSFKNCQLKKNNSF